MKRQIQLIVAASVLGFSAVAQDPTTTRNNQSLNTNTPTTSDRTSGSINRQPPSDTTASGSINAATTSRSGRSLNAPAVSDAVGSSSVNAPAASGVRTRNGGSVTASSYDTTRAATNTPADADNTARNVRDRDSQTQTPLDQGNNQADINTTAQIRKQIMAAKRLSIDAKNVKIITANGHVTLRGPVNTPEEKRIISTIAQRVARGVNVDNQLEVKATASNP